MKKPLLLRIAFTLLVYLLNPPTSSAQTLTCQASCPQPGEVFSMRTSSPVLNSAGANQVWNFSSMVAISPATHLISYATASSVPSSSFYPQADLARIQGTSTVFINSNNTGLHKANSTTTSVNIEPMELPLPFAYGNTYTETIISTSTVGTDTFVTTSQNSFNAHGFGTLILPSGTFPDVVAIKFTSSQATTKNGSPEGYTLNNTSYYYYSQNISHHLLYVRFLSTNGPADFFPYTEFLSHVGTGLKNQEEKDHDKLIASPNPAGGQVNIKFNSNAKGTIFLKNSLGQQLMEQDCTEENCILNLNSLPEGIYIVYFVGDTYTVTKKLIISR